jgi:hypothetical protein
VFVVVAAHHREIRGWKHVPDLSRNSFEHEVRPYPAGDERRNSLQGGMLVDVQVKPVRRTGIRGRGEVTDLRAVLRLAA